MKCVFTKFEEIEGVFEVRILVERFRSIIDLKNWLYSLPLGKFWNCYFMAYMICHDIERDDLTTGL